MRYRRLARDYERIIEHHEAMAYWAADFIMTKRLTRYQTRQPQPARWGSERPRPVQQAALWAHRFLAMLFRASLNGTDFSGRRTSYRFAVHNGVDYLCKTTPSLCAHWGNAGESIAGPPL